MRLPDVVRLSRSLRDDTWNGTEKLQFVFRQLTVLTASVHLSCGTEKCKDKMLRALKEFWRSEI